MSDNVNDIVRFKSTRTAASEDKALGKGDEHEASNVRRNDPAADLKFTLVPIDRLTAAPRRVRRASRKQTEKVRKAIATFGFVAPVLVSGAGEVIDGHLRLEAARQLGMTEIPCILIDHLSATEIRSLRITLNRIQETGEWDEDALRSEFEDLLDMNVDLTITGFEPPEIDVRLDIREPGETGPDLLDGVDDWHRSPGDPVSREGDLWRLGDHRLLCGNARKSEDLERLMGPETAALLITDPPYNVKVNGHVRGRGAGFGEFPEGSGELSPDAFRAFLAETLGRAQSHLAPGALTYAFMDWRHSDVMLTVFRMLDLDLVNLCVWVKPNGGMGSLYRSRHELIFVGGTLGAAHANNVQLGRFGRNRTNVWEYAGATGGRQDADDNFAAHPTVKPIRLVMDAILDVTELGDLVLDPFLGSGTTLLAAERTRRRGRGLELDPAYVDVAIRRWQEMTGRDAIHADTGRTFTEHAGWCSAGCEDGEAHT